MLASTMNRRDEAGQEPTFFLSEDDPEPRWNGPILTIAQMIKFVMTSAAEAELGALFVTAKELVPIRQTLIEMGWKQPMTPIQTDNTTAAGVVNNTIIPKKSKSMDLRFWWLKCREFQQKFRYYCAPGRDNWGDYSTKHHPSIYHESNRARFAGIKPTGIKQLPQPSNRVRFNLEERTFGCAGAA